MLTAIEARRRTKAFLESKGGRDFYAIMAGIEGASKSGHYCFVFDGIIDEPVKIKLRELGYKILPPSVHYSEYSTQIEW